MDRELLKRARELEDKIREYNGDIKRLTCNAHPSSMLKIEVNQYYGDMGKSFTNVVEFDGDIAKLLFDVILSSLEIQRDLLEKQLENL